MNIDTKDQLFTECLHDMKYILDNISNNIRGLEISKKNVQACIEKGLTVIEGNAELDLGQFPNKSFNYVILSQTLQAFLNPEKVLYNSNNSFNLHKFTIRWIK